MTLAEILFRFIAGGAVVVIVSLLARSDHPYLSGLFVLFPAVTLVGYFFMSLNTPTLTIKKMALFSIYSYPTTLGFLVAFYFLQTRYNATISLFLSIGVWVFVAIILIYLNTRFFQIGS